MLIVKLIKNCYAPFEIFLWLWVKNLICTPHILPISCFFECCLWTWNICHILSSHILSLCYLFAKVFFRSKASLSSYHFDEVVLSLGILASDHPLKGTFDRRKKKASLNTIISLLGHLLNNIFSLIIIPLFPTALQFYLSNSETI